MALNLRSSRCMRSNSDSCAPAAGAAPTAAAATAPSRKARRVAVATRSALGRNDRPRIVRAEYGAEVLPRARAADRAPLAHADPMSVAGSAERDAREPPVEPRRSFDGKIRAVEDLASARAQHEANVVAAERVEAALRLDRQRRHASGERVLGRRERAHGAGASG